MDIVYKHEKSLFTIVLIISLIVWIAILVLTVGLLLVYLLLGFIGYLFVQSAFITYLRGSGVKISNQQHPELYAQFKDCCRVLGIEKEPDLYILNADGFLNALATRFLRKRYVVLFSSIVDALEKRSAGVRFYIGHELGHIARGHLTQGTLLFPGSILPIIGPAYSRAKEYTCDLYGLKCCLNTEDAAIAMSVLARGPDHWSKLNLNDFAAQSSETGGFWMSFHELVGDYPWLCKRMQHLIATGAGSDTQFPRRSFFAWIFALFVPRLGIGGSGGAFGLLIVIAIIGILAAVALPAYNDYQIRALTTPAVALGQQIADRATDYIDQNRALPESLEDIGVPEDIASDVVKAVAITDDGFVLYLQGHQSLQGETIIFRPYIDADDSIAWRCDEGSLEVKYLPPECR